MASRITRDRLDFEARQACLACGLDPEAIWLQRPRPAWRCSAAMAGRPPHRRMPRRPRAPESAPWHPSRRRPCQRPRHRCPCLSPGPPLAAPSAPLLPHHVHPDLGPFPTLALRPGDLLTVTLPDGQTIEIDARDQHAVVVHQIDSDGDGVALLEVAPEPTPTATHRSQRPNETPASAKGRGLKPFYIYARPYTQRPP